MIGIDLYAGAGGLSLGASAAGIDIRVAVESEPNAARTHAHNFPHARVLAQDIQTINKLPINGKGRQIIIFGGPPCQGFSTSNQRTRSSENPKNWMFKDFFRIVKIHSPDWVVFENVKGILETEGGCFVEMILTGFEKLGYTMTHGILNAADFGVPQRRERFFLVGSKHGVKVEFPKPLNKQKITVWDAISDLPSLQNGACDSLVEYRELPNSSYASSMRNGLKLCSNHLVTRNAPEILERYRHVPQGGNWEQIPEYLMNNYKDRSRCHTGIYHRLKSDKPSLVIGNFRKNMLIHPYENRGLSVREAARLQSFPDHFEFMGSIGFQQQQVGNAVPPLLAKAVFELILCANNCL